MKEQKVILVNEQDEPIGVMEKMKTHQQGLLHRAFSIFIFDSKGRMLLQQRAAGKYHGGNLWTNACCSHPNPGEDLPDAARRRLREELGIGTAIREIFSFTYQAKVENNLVEHEYDHVFVGEYDAGIHPDPAEVADYRYVSLDEIRKEITARPEQFTSWFKIAFPKIENWWQQQYAAKKG